MPQFLSFCQSAPTNNLFAVYVVQSGRIYNSCSEFLSLSEHIDHFLFYGSKHRLSVEGVRLYAYGVAKFHVVGAGLAV